MIFPYKLRSLIVVYKTFIKKKKIDIRKSLVNDYLRPHPTTDKPLWSKKK